MARARNVKPGFFTNDTLAEVEPLGRILFVGLWCIADREGRLKDRPRKIKAEILPYDDTDTDDLLDQLAQRGFILRYGAGDDRFIQIVNFLEHQDPHYKEKASEIPAPEGFPASGITAGGVPEKVRQAVFDRDGRSCLRCGATEGLSLDHVIPRSKGGTHDESNLQTLCSRCNSAKNNRQSSADHRAMIGRPSDQHPRDLPPLIPDSGFRIPDSGSPTPAPEPRDGDSAAPASGPAKPEKPAQPEGVLPHVWAEWLRHRGKLSPVSVRRQTDRLAELNAMGFDPNAVILQSIERGWSGLFELKGVARASPGGAPTLAEQRQRNMDILTGKAAQHERVIEGISGRVGGAAVLAISGDLRQSGDHDVGGGGPARSAAGLG